MYIQYEIKMDYTHAGWDGEMIYVRAWSPIRFSFSKEALLHT